MDNNALVRGLVFLLKEDFNAVQVYEEAMQNISIKDGDVRDALVRFRDDHNRHITDLSKAIRALGAEPPQLTRDFIGRSIRDMDDLSGGGDTLTVLRGLYSVLRMNADYTSVIAGKNFSSFSQEVQMLLQNNLKDEQRHRDYIVNLLRIPVSAAKS
jgi:hypothetical protein